jgi:hypothetical protein
MIQSKTVQGSSMMSCRGALLFCCTALSLSAQKPSLRLTAASSLPVAYIGQAFTVTAEGLGGQFTHVTVIPPGKIPFPGEQTKPPFSFVLSIPRDMEPGMYPLVADGVTESGDHMPSNRLWVDVERPDQPISIKTEFESYELDLDKSLHMDMSGPVNVYGTFQDGSVVPLTASTQTSYVPEDPSIIKVTTNGVIHPLKLGTTYLEVHVGAKVVKVEVIVMPRR